MAAPVVRRLHAHGATPPPQLDARVDAPSRILRISAAAATCLATDGRVTAQVGHPSPPRGVYLEGYHDRPRQAGDAPGEPELFVRAMREISQLQPRCAGERAARTLAPRLDRQGAPQGRHRRDARAAARSRRLPCRHRPRLGHRCGRDGDVVASRRPPGRDAGVGKLRRRLGHGRGQAAQAVRRHRARGRHTARSSTSPTSTGTPTSSSPGTARPPASACRPATPSPPTGRG